MKRLQEKLLEKWVVLENNTAVKKLETVYLTLGPYSFTILMAILALFTK